MCEVRSRGKMIKFKKKKTNLNTVISSKKKKKWTVMKPIQWTERANCDIGGWWFTLAVNAESTAG